jgi:multicomponent Na+:H+ antiporter subunit A
MPPELSIVAGAVALPFAAAGVTPVVYRLVGDRTGYLGAVVALACFGLLGSQLGTRGVVSSSWVPSLDVSLRFYVDGWALLFALLASGIGALIFTYSARYMHEERNLARFYATMLAFMGSILGVALAADLIVVFLFWELTSLCSFVLIGHYTDERASQYAARMAMIVTVGGGLFLLAGLLLLSVAAGTVLDGSAFDLAAMLADADAVQAALREEGLFVPVLLSMGVAAGAKSAQVPLHFWLPNAMVAPTPVSAFLHSATMVKVGVYFVGRLRPLLGSPEWTLLFATVGLLTMTAGAMLAVVATDLKELLAYSTASHLGLMVAGFGFESVYGGEAGAFHLLNHALFKAPLFLVAGIVAHEVGTRRLDGLSGLWRDLPVTAVIAAITGLSMAGIPPFSGFYSKELLFEATYEAAHAAGGLTWLYPALAVFASVFTVLYSLRFLAIFVGDQPDAIASVPRPSASLVVPPGVLALATAVVSVSPQFAVDVIVQQAVDSTAAGTPEVHVGLPDHLSPPVAMSAVAIVGGVATYPAIDRIRAGTEEIVRARALRPSWWYDKLLMGVEETSPRLGDWIHNGLLRTYVTWSFVAASALVLSGYAATGEVMPATGETAVTAAMALVLVVAVVAAVAVVIAPSHVAGVLSLSILGFMVAIFYILASAPDLALTQLVVETLVLLIFLLVIEQLPAFYADVNRWVIARDVGVSLFVGATAFLTVILSSPAASGDPTAIARYYATEAVPEAGGTNVVNVILVDFRAFDTLGELFVITVAGLSVLVLITMRNRGETK